MVSLITLTVLFVVMALVAISFISTLMGLRRDGTIRAFFPANSFSKDKAEELFADIKSIQRFALDNVTVIKGSISGWSAAALMTKPVSFTEEQKERQKKEQFQMDEELWLRYTITYRENRYTHDLFCIDTAAARGNGDSQTVGLYAQEVFEYLKMQFRSLGVEDAPVLYTNQSYQRRFMHSLVCNTVAAMREHKTGSILRHCVRQAIRNLQWQYLRSRDSRDAVFHFRTNQLGRCSIWFDLNSDQENSLQRLVLS